ncbi:MAG TPA: MFS transporter [Conexibacter sp.]|nr:MFS transporter [Conexibacter sp.]
MRRLFLLVGSIVFVDLMFFAAITPLLPWYTERFDLSKTGAGILAGTYAAGTLLGALPSGWLTARLGSRRTMLIGLAMTSVASFGFAFGRSIAVLDVMRFLQGVGGACTWAAGFGWLLSLVAPADRGKTIGKALSAALVGLLLGPALGALARAIGPEAPFSAVGVLALVLVVVTLRIDAPPAGVVVAERPLRTSLRNRPIRLGMWLVTVPALAFGAVEVLVPLALDRLGATSLVIAGTFIAASAIEAVAQVLVGRAADRRGRMWPIRLCLAGSLAFLLVLPLPDVAWLLVGVTVIGSVLMGALNTPAMALLSDNVEAAGVDQGFGSALMNLVWASGQVVGTVAGAALAEATTDAVTYLLLAAVCGATLGLIVRRPAARPALVSEQA